VYVLATDIRSDYDSTRDKVLAGFAQKMQSRKVNEGWVLVPMPEWNLDSFVYACNHPQDSTGSDGLMHTIQGALILRVYSVSYWITHRTFQEAPTSAVDADAIYATCQTKQAPKPTIVYTWHDAVQYKDGTMGITNLTSLALLLPLVAVYQSFVPGKSQMTVTNKPFLQPYPLPSGSTVTTVANSYNPQAAGNTTTLATSLLASGLSYTEAVLNTPPPVNDIATWNAVNKLTAQMAADTGCLRYTSNPHFLETPMPGIPRAPFCPPTPTPTPPK